MTFTCISFSWNALVGSWQLIKGSTPAWLGLPVLGTSCSYLSGMELPQVWTGQTTGRVDQRKRMFSKAPTSPAGFYFDIWAVKLQSAHGLEMSFYVSCKTGYNKTGEQISHHLSVSGTSRREDATVKSNSFFSHRLFLCPPSCQQFLLGDFEAAKLHLQENYATSPTNGSIWCCE